MEKVVQLNNESPNSALIYFLSLCIIVLCGVIVALWKDRKVEEVKNFNMLLRAVDSFKDNAIALEGLKDKLNQLLLKSWVN